MIASNGSDPADNQPATHHAGEESLEVLQQLSLLDGARGLVLVHLIMIPSNRSDPANNQPATHHAGEESLEVLQQLSLLDGARGLVLVHLGLAQLLLDGGQLRVDLLQAPAGRAHVRRQLRLPVTLVLQGGRARPFADTRNADDRVNTP